MGMLGRWELLKPLGLRPSEAWVDVENGKEDERHLNSKTLELSLTGEQGLQGNGMLSGKSAFEATFERKKPKMRASFVLFFYRHIFLSLEKEVGKEEEDATNTGFCFACCWCVFTLESDKINSCNPDIMHSLPTE